MILVRRDQRAFLLHFTGRCAAKSPHNRAGSVPQKSALVTSCILNAECSAAFRPRFRAGRFTPPSFPPSLRLSFTFPFAKPLAEAFVGSQGTNAHAAQPDGRDFQIAWFECYPPFAMKSGTPFATTELSRLRI
jgi:hypothetical protein